MCRAGRREPGGEAGAGDGRLAPGTGAGSWCGASGQSRLKGEAGGGPSRSYPQGTGRGVTSAATCGTTRPSVGLAESDLDGGTTGPGGRAVAPGEDRLPGWGWGRDAAWTGSGNSPEGRGWDLVLPSIMESGQGRACDPYLPGVGSFPVSKINVFNEKRSSRVVSASGHGDPSL